MSDLKSIIFIAQQMIEEHGAAAAALISDRAIAHHLNGDHESAAMWHKVAAAIRVIEAGPDDEPAV